jgi:hypothetical protein
VFGEDGYENPGHRGGEFPRSDFWCVWEEQGLPQERTREGEELTTSNSQGDHEGEQSDDQSDNASQTNSSTSSVTNTSGRLLESEDTDDDLSPGINWDAEEYDSSDSGVGRTRYMF